MIGVDRHRLAGLISTQKPFSSRHPEEALPLADAILDTYRVIEKIEGCGQCDWCSPRWEGATCPHGFGCCQNCPDCQATR